jgi:hypothetical protein
MIVYNADEMGVEVSDTAFYKSVELAIHSAEDDKLKLEKSKLQEEKQRFYNKQE